MTPGPQRLTATEAGEQMAAGALSAETLTSACLFRIGEREVQVRAWACLQPEAALEAARRSDGAGPDGRTGLSGIPIGIKDVILTRDLPTRHNSPLYEDAAPTLDAPCVAVLRDAGAVILGKTETVEFAATGRTAPTRNPHDPERTPGGSSSGSAAAVADFHVPIALGTQTGGSIIRPAAYCGVWGVKPTWGLVSREGAKTFAPSLDTIGWFSRSAEDLALMYDILAPDGEVGLRALEPRDARIAVWRTAEWAQAQGATRAALDAAIDRLKAAGADVVDLTPPEMFDDAVAVQLTIMKGEARASFLSEQRLHGDTLHPGLRGYVETPVTAADLRAAQDRGALCRIAFDEIVAPFDAVLGPSVTGEAPIGLAATGSYVFSAPWSLLQAPCVNVPGPTGPNGLPVGLTVGGGRYSDRRVLATAAMLGQLIAA